MPNKLAVIFAFVLLSVTSALSASTEQLNLVPKDPNVSHVYRPLTFEEEREIPKESIIDSARTVNPATSPKWITISYLDLIDKNALTQTGETVGTVLQNPNQRGAVQQFVDKYSYLLQLSIEMLFGRDSLPHRNVVDFYPVGTKQPAWIAIFRNGRIFTTTDSNNHARLFLLGDDPKKAYEANYSVIRHCLRALLPKDGSDLFLEVFAYKNKYQFSELELNIEPYTFKASSFPPPSGVVAIDLVGLEEFFNKQGQLEGAKLDEKQGLILYAKEGPKETLAGRSFHLPTLQLPTEQLFTPGIMTLL